MLHRRTSDQYAGVFHDNIFVEVAYRGFQQLFGIPMRINYATLLEDLLFTSYG